VADEGVDAGALVVEARDEPVEQAEQVYRQKIKDPSGLRIALAL